MAQPPGGWEQLATKRDLADLEIKTQAAFVEVHAKMDKGFAEVKEQFAEVKEQFAEVKGQFAVIDTRFADLSDKRSRDVWAFVVAITSDHRVHLRLDFSLVLAVRTGLNRPIGPGRIRIGF